MTNNLTTASLVSASPPVVISIYFIFGITWHTQLSIPGPLRSLLCGYNLPPLGVWWMVFMKKVLKSSNEQRAFSYEFYVKESKGLLRTQGLGAFPSSALPFSESIAEWTVCFDVDYVFIKRLHGGRKHRQHCPQPH